MVYPDTPLYSAGYSLCHPTPRYTADVDKNNRAKMECRLLDVTPGLRIRLFWLDYGPVL